MKTDNTNFWPDAIMKIIIATLLLGAMAAVILMSSRWDKALMSVDYCWDDTGTHYVIPDERCTH